MDARYDQAWKEVSEKAEAIASQLRDLSVRMDELKKDQFLKGQLLALPECDELDELEEYSHKMAVLSEGIDEAISWIDGNLAIARGEDY